MGSSPRHSGAIGPLAGLPGSGEQGPFSASAGLPRHLARPLLGSPRASSTPLWQEPRYESQTNKPADPHATRQAQLGPEASAPVPLGKQGHRFQGRKVLSRLPRRSARGRPRRACAPAAPGAALASGKEETRLTPHGGRRRKRFPPPKRAVRQEGFLTHFCLPPAPMPATA